MKDLLSSDSEQTKLSCSFMNGDFHWIVTGSCFFWNEMPWIRLHGYCPWVPKHVFDEEARRTAENQTRTRRCGRRSIYFKRVYLSGYQARADFPRAQVAWGTLQLATKYWFWIAIWPCLFWHTTRYPWNDPEPHCSWIFISLERILKNTSEGQYFVNPVYPFAWFY